MAEGWFGLLTVTEHCKIPNLKSCIHTKYVHSGEEEIWRRIAGYRSRFMEEADVIDPAGCEWLYGNRISTFLLYRFDA